MDGLTPFAPLPEPAPLAMPEQSLRSSASAPRRLPSSPSWIWLRRLLVIGGAALMTAAAAHEMYLVVEVGGLTPLEIAVLVLFIVLFAWIAFAFTSAIGGLFSLLAGGGLRLGIDPAAPLPTLTSRTALLMPTYNEQPARVMAGLQAIAEAVVAAGAADAFDIFILSDTTAADVWIAEEAAFLALRSRIPGIRIFYRRRPANTERKSGNIAEWVGRFGAAYPVMLVLDADSVMTGASIIRLVDAMERHPDVGMIQTLPIIVNGTTLFARTQQFAGRVYGPLIAHGIAWWHGAEGNYWGHNAVIRTQAFAACAGLPHLAGRKPFGGHILSHDFVEAALVRRGGWAVHMVPALAGSYEESPPSLTDLAIRDRRWCQGNLQHSLVLPARGLHWVSRLHLLTGIGSYITAPLWLIFLLAGILLSLQSRFAAPVYFEGRSLFPIWPAVDPIRSKWVFVGTMAVLLAPKILATLALLTQRAARVGCGGGFRAVASLLIETIIAGLIAPIAMLNQSMDVGSILIGRDSGWTTQRRDDGGIPFAETWRRYRLHTAIGVVLGVSSWLVSPSLFLWMLPVVIGLALAVPLVAFTAARGPGLAMLRLGLLRIPEEQAPPPVLARAQQLQTELAGLDSPGVVSLFHDPTLMRAHRAMLAPPRSRGAGPFDPVLLVGLAKLDEAGDLPTALDSLSAREKTAVLAHPAGLDRLAALGIASP